MVTGFGSVDKNIPTDWCALRVREGIGRTKPSCPDRKTIDTDCRRRPMITNLVQIQEEITTGDWLHLYFNVPFMKIGG